MDKAGSLACPSSPSLPDLTVPPLRHQATVNMFYYQRKQTEPVPLAYHNLELTCRPLEPGEPYLLHILSRRRRDQPPLSFTFQEYVPQGKGYVHNLKSPTTPRQPTHPVLCSVYIYI